MLLRGKFVVRSRAGGSLKLSQSARIERYKNLIRLPLAPSREESQSLEGH
jgi:hypothetical protein